MYISYNLRGRQRLKMSSFVWRALPQISKPNFQTRSTGFAIHRKGLTCVFSIHIIMASIALLLDKNSWWNPQAFAFKLDSLGYGALFHSSEMNFLNNCFCLFCLKVLLIITVQSSLPRRSWMLYLKSKLKAAANSKMRYSRLSRAVRTTFSYVFFH